MEPAHKREINNVQYELDMKVTEADDAQFELATLGYKITHGQPLGGELKGLSHVDLELDLGQALGNADLK